MALSRVGGKDGLRAGQARALNSSRNSHVPGEAFALRSKRVIRFSNQAIGVSVPAHGQARRYGRADSAEQELPAIECVRFAREDVP